MITLKLWNSLSDESRAKICKTLGTSGKIENPYHHNFDYDEHGKKLKSILESCNLQKDGTINVVVPVKPTYGAAKKVDVKKPVETKNPVEVKVPKRYRYIGYFYEYDEEGETIDDFKEWCEADSIEDAKFYFQDDHRGCLNWLKNKGSFRHGTTLEGIRVETMDGKYVKEVWF